MPLMIRLQRRWESFQPRGPWLAVNGYCSSFFAIRLATFTPLSPFTYLEIPR